MHCTVLALHRTLSVDVLTGDTTRASCAQGCNLNFEVLFCLDMYRLHEIRRMMEHVHFFYGAPTNNVKLCLVLFVDGGRLHAALSLRVHSSEL